MKQLFKVMWNMRQKFKTVISIIYDTLKLSQIIQYLIAILFTFQNFNIGFMCGIYAAIILISFNDCIFYKRQLEKNRVTRQFTLEF